MFINQFKVIKAVKNKRYEITMLQRFNGDFEVKRINLLVRPHKTVAICTINFNNASNIFNEFYNLFEGVA